MCWGQWPELERATGIASLATSRKPNSLFHFTSLARNLNEKLPVQPSEHHPKLLSDLERRAAVPHESRESNDCRRVRECYQITIIEEQSRKNP